MSLETVVEDIRQQARERAEEIRSQANRRAEEIIAEAEADAEDIAADRERAIERQIDQEREQKLSSANLQAKQSRLEARRDMLDAVREDVEQALVDLDGDEREELTRALLDAAATEFDGAADVEVYGRSEDRGLIEGLLADYEDFTYAGDYDCLGGVVVESRSSRLRVNNTFDSVLERVWDDQLKAISERLFEQ